MDYVFKKAFVLSGPMARLPHVVVRKGESFTCWSATQGGNGGGVAAKVSDTVLRLVPFTVHAVIDTSVGASNFVRDVALDVLDFTKMMRSVLGMHSIEATARLTWPVLFPGFDGVTDGTTVTLF